MTPKEEIDKLVNEAYSAIASAEAIADKHGLSFDFDLSYGMGGTYYPRMTKEDALVLLASETDLSYDQKEAIEKALEEDSDEDDDSTGWLASSQGC